MSKRLESTLWGMLFAGMASAALLSQIRSDAASMWFALMALRSFINAGPGLSSYAFNEYGHDAKLYNGIAELEERIRTLEAERHWQPIETAPKDGTKIDLWLSSPDGVEQWRETDCWWNADRKLWCNLRGMWDCATHWMPKPKAPDAARKGETE